jgi:hypothetical protein
MLFDLVGPKIMTVYVAEIKGRGIAAFHANNGSDAERLVRDRVFRDDFMVLATGWAAALGWRNRHRGPPSAPRRGGKMAGITRQSDPPGQYRGERCRMDRFPRCTHRPTKR